MTPIERIDEIEDIIVNHYPDDEKFTHTELTRILNAILSVLDQDKDYSRSPENLHLESQS